MASDVEIIINKSLLDCVVEMRSYAESESKRFFVLQRDHSGIDQANYRGQYAMATRMLTLIDLWARKLENDK